MDECIERRHKDTQTSKADLIRTMCALRSIAERRGLKGADEELSGFSEKLMSSRFHLAIVGQMKRGKSSIVNALLGDEILPTGILPLTSVVTRVRYNGVPAAKIIYQSGNAEEIETHCLAEYITEAKNPGNRKQVAAAELLWPAPLLRLGVDLVDTPGIGSTQTHNTVTTENYLREMDAAVVVLSVDPPITAIESEFVKVLRREVPRLLFVVNKTDMATAGEVEELLAFLRCEIANKCGIAGPEIYAVSARYALDELRSACSPERARGIRGIADRLEYLAAEEKEQLLLQSVGQDVLRIAETLRFAASMGNRARAMNDAELASVRLQVESELGNAERDFRDLQHLLHKDIGIVVERIEEDLKRHIQEATPEVKARFGALQCEHPRETREKLGTLLDEFVRDEIRRVFEDWRVQEDERIRSDLSGLSDRVIARANHILETLQQVAGVLFDVPVSPINIRASLAVESRLYYYTEPTFKFLQEKLIFLLPRRMQRGMVFRRMTKGLEMELRRNAARLRYDYLERVEKAIALFEKQLSEAIKMVMDSVRIALAPDCIADDRVAEEMAQIDAAVEQCASILAESGRG